MEIKFRRDTAFRKQLFTEAHFAHPAKMDAQLLIWITEKYTKAGEIILDLMFGSGTTMLACTIGRHVIGIELEQKFVDMAKANWEKVRTMPQLGYEMGTCQILQGDARNLEGILADKIITSPPYANQLQRWGNKEIPTMEQKGLHQESKDGIGSLPYGSMDSINLPQVDSVITSPPYEEAMGKKHHSPRADKLAQEKSNPVTYTDKVDHIITSPPYEDSVSASTGGERDQSSARQREKRLKGKRYDPAKYQGGVGRNLEVDFQYSKADDNIGNLKSDSYLSAMLQVYQQCHKVLKPQGLMILVTKNFIRNQKEIRLDEDTIKLCEQAGFTFIERHYRKLTSQSFWRVIYKQKYPDAPVLDKEDILIFNK